MAIKSLLRASGLAKQNKHLVLVGSAGGGLSFMMLWFPVIAVLFYEAILLFLDTVPAINNLQFIVLAWMLIWLLLTANNLMKGTARHFYLVDLKNRNITHLNSGESSPLEVEEQQVDYSSEELVVDPIVTRVLKQPLYSGWHLYEDAGKVADITPENAAKLPCWELPGLKAYLTHGDRSVSLWTVFLGLNVLPLIFYFSFNMVATWLALQLVMFGAWTLSQTLTWLTQRSDYHLLQQLLASHGLPTLDAKPSVQYGVASKRSWFRR